MKGKKKRKQVTVDQRKRAMLDMLREARAVLYREAESFGDAAAILEHVGQIQRGAVLQGLNHYKEAILSIARNAPPIQWQRVEFLFDTVRIARNDSVHSGDFIRHHATRLVELFLIMEEGLSMSAKTVGDLMVQNPTTAALWHNVAAIRRAMLTNSFSFLPVQDPNGKWKLLSDVEVVRYLKRATTDDRNKLLGRQLKKALADGEIGLTDCICLSPEKDVEGVAKTLNHVPFLVVEMDGNKERLVGILTAFDLL